VIVASFLGPIQDLVHNLLYGIHDHLGISWAWSIVVMTIIVRVALLPLTIKQMQAMQAMQRLQPEVKKLQAKYKHDRQRLNTEMMALYKEHRVNPLGSCLPLLLQFPIFIALFYELRSFSSQISHGHPPPGDLGWLWGFIPYDHNHPLGIAVHVNNAGWAGIVLVVVYIGSQLAATLLAPATMDRTQRYIFMAMPFVFTFVVINFPVGLMIYWITTNLWTVGQTVLIRKMMPPPLPIAASGASGGESPSPGGKDGGGGRDGGGKAKGTPAPSDGKAATGRRNGLGRSKEPKTPPKRTSRTPPSSTGRRRRGR
jgi:YidC/Oxa1 family membrane protein insertase